jgi:hypothetical protein
VEKRNMKSTARLVELRQQREQEEQRDRDQVVAEFGADPQRLADEILRHRHGLAQVAEAIEWMKKGAPFGMIRSGPYWKPKSEQAHGH